MVLCEADPSHTTYKERLTETILEYIQTRIVFLLNFKRAASKITTTKLNFFDRMFLHMIIHICVEILLQIYYFADVANTIVSKP